jgi:hypothetical protein
MVQTPTVSTYRCSIVFIGSSRTGKQTLIEACQSVCKREEGEENKNSFLQVNNTHSKRMSLTRFYSSTNYNSSESFQEIPVSSRRKDGTIPDNKIVYNSSRDHIRHELVIHKFYNTGFNYFDQEIIMHADAIVILVDVTNKFSMERARFFHNKVKHIRDNFYNNGNGIAAFQIEEKTQPIFLLGTKCDQNCTRQVSTVEGIRLADHWNCSYMEVSSNSSNYKGVDIFLRELVNMLSNIRRSYQC